MWISLTTFSSIAAVGFPRRHRHFIAEMWPQTRGIILSLFCFPRKPEHKIQSANGPPIIQLRQVPKMLGRVAQQWAEAAFVVSFKLETDHSLLVKKAREALEKYKHQVSKKMKLV